MNTHSTQFHTLIINETKRRLFQESIPRIVQCLSLLTEEEVWFRPNNNSNSAGNLVLHLCGNARQWICAGLGKLPDLRQRQLEFDEKGPLAVHVLLQKLVDLENDVEKVLDKLSAEVLLNTHPVQGFSESGIAILIHVVEHFSYHTGQITFLVKWLKNQDTGYYFNLDLDLRS